MEILLIRHGESEADILQVHEGRADFPLTDTGRKQVALMAEKVKKNFLPASIFASPLIRAKETAEKLGLVIGCEVQFEEELMEFNNGVLAGLSFEEAKKYKLPEEIELHERVEKGESAIEFRMRIESIFSKIITQSNEERIEIVAHGGVINCILRSFFKMPISKDTYFINGDTAIHLVEINDKYRVVHFLNNTSHLEGLKR